jgi:hypothetical protein
MLKKFLWVGDLFLIILLLFLLNVIRTFPSPQPKQHLAVFQMDDGDILKIQLKSLPADFSELKSCTVSVVGSIPPSGNIPLPAPPAAEIVLRMNYLNQDGKAGRMREDVFKLWGAPFLSSQQAIIVYRPHMIGGEVSEPCSLSLSQP